MVSSMTNHPVSRWVLLKVVFRSFWLQSCWNFQGMQSLGFAYSILPVLRALYISKQDRLQAVKRHVEFFNTHPYCSAIILGVVGKLETDAVVSQDKDFERISRLKTSMMGPLAALGDTVFWASLKPALALLGVAIVLATHTSNKDLMIWGPIVFLVLYSIPHLGLRIRGVFAGYQRGLDVIKDLRQYNPQFIARKIGYFLAVLLGAVAAMYPILKASNVLGPRYWDIVCFFSFTGVLFFLFRKGFSITLAVYGLIVLSIVLALFGWI